MKNSRTQLAALLLFTLSLLTGAQGQTGAASSIAPLLNGPLQRRLAQIEARSGKVPGAARHPPAPHVALPVSQRLPGAPIAAERYVFGRMDLATDADPDAVAIGAFQTGGPQS